MINLQPGERIDDLERNGYRIIQNPEKFCFGMDAVVLSDFAKIKRRALAKKPTVIPAIITGAKNLFGAFAIQYSL